VETGAVIKFLFLQGKVPKEIHAILTETLAVGLRTYHHPSKYDPKFLKQFDPKRDFSLRNKKG